VLRLSLDLGGALEPGGAAGYWFGLALAPDGRRLAVPAVGEGSRALWLLDLTSGDGRELVGTSGAQLPFWSPDGRTLGFFARGTMQALDLATGRATVLGEAPSPQGAAWLSTGDILFAPEESGALWRRSPDGRVQPWSELTAPDEHSHRFPQEVRLGRDVHVLFFVAASRGTRQGIWLAPLDRPADRTRLIGSAAAGLAIGDTLLHASGEALVAQRIDPSGRGLVGRPLLVVPRAGHDERHALHATAGADLLIVSPPRSTLRQLTWVDREGRVLGTAGEPMDAWDVRSASRTVAVSRIEPQLGTLDVWMYSADRALPLRLSTSIEADRSPAFAPDASRLAWSSGRGKIVVRPTDAGSPEKTLYTFDVPVEVEAWTRDGRWLALTAVRPDTGRDVVLLRDDGTEVIEYLRTPFDEADAAPSPDGRWLAYVSDESGREEIYVDTFPRPGRRVRLTLGGAADPRWRRDGRELYFRRSSELHVVRLGLQDGRPVPLSTARLFDAGAAVRAYDASPDGQQFLLNLPAPGTTREPLQAIANVADLLRPLYDREAERRRRGDDAARR
jgi:Tol biopolymer transport system component